MAGLIEIGAGMLAKCHLNKVSLDKTFCANAVGYMDIAPQSIVLIVRENNDKFEVLNGNGLVEAARGRVFVYNLGEVNDSDAVRVIEKTTGKRIPPDAMRVEHVLHEVINGQLGIDHAEADEEFRVDDLPILDSFLNMVTIDLDKTKFREVTRKCPHCGERIYIE